MKFDTTINLGHILTFVGFLAVGFSAYATLDKRLTVSESERVTAREAIQSQNNRTDKTLDRIENRLDTIDARLTVINQHLPRKP